MQSALAEFHRRHIDVEALQQLAQHLAFGLDEPLMEFAFHALEVFPDKAAGAKCVDVLAQSSKRIHSSCVGVGTHRRDMKY